MTTLSNMARETAAVLKLAEDLSKITIKFTLVDATDTNPAAIVCSVTSTNGGITTTTYPGLAGALRDVEAWARRISGAALSARLSEDADILASRMELALAAI